jgi:hypothetical protein
VSAAVERVLEALVSVRQTESGYRAFCPVHGDTKTRHLSIKEGDDGRALLHCHRCGANGDRVAEAIGLKPRDLFERRNGGKQRGKIAARYDYHGPDGTLLFQAVRYEPKGFSQRQPDGNGGWIRNLRGIETVLYRLPEVLEWVRSDKTIYVVEGEKDADRLASHGLAATCNPMGALKWRDSYSETLRGAHVVLVPDADKPGRGHVEAVARSLQGKAASVRVLELPGLSWGDDLPEKHGPDVSDWLDAGHTAAELEKLAREAAEHVPQHEEPPAAIKGKVPDGEKEERKPTQAELLVRCASEAQLFHTPAGDAYATVPVNDHRETHPIKAKGFRSWLRRGFFKQYDRPPGAQALQDALGLLEARAQFDGPEMEVHVRVAEHEDAIYVDLANERWEAVKITPAGWRVVSDPPVRFRRPRGMRALPTPKKGKLKGLVDLLRSFINVADDDALWLIVAWLVQAFRPTGPYPVLILQGEQGSAKSTLERLLRALVDPSTAPLRTTPRNERDLIIAATNSWCVAFDNISSLPPWLSDALCRLSTGGGFGARELYTDSEEVLFDATRPVILNGITDVATRPDLLDRALVITLPPIPEEKRKPEAELHREFEKARSSILGALFNAVAGALDKVEEVQLEGMPRMADFAVWATAAEDALGWEPRTFMDAYSGNRMEATESALDADVVAGAVRRFMADREEWIGTSAVLWQNLKELVDEDVRNTRAWPKAPNTLTKRLRRLAPALRDVGIEYWEPPRTGKSGDRIKELRKKVPVKDRQHRQCRQPDEKVLQNPRVDADGTDKADDRNVGSDATVTEDRQAENRMDKLDRAEADGADGTDGVLRPYSDRAVAADRSQGDLRT